MSRCLMRCSWWAHLLSELTCGLSSDVDTYVLLIVGESNEHVCAVIELTFVINIVCYNQDSLYRSPLCCRVKYRQLRRFGYLFLPPVGCGPWDIGPRLFRTIQVARRAIFLWWAPVSVVTTVFSGSNSARIGVWKSIMRRVCRVWWMW